MFEASGWQATPGKRILRLYVTDLNGHRHYVRARGDPQFCKAMISSLTFLVGYLVAGFTEKKQALHDILPVASSCENLRKISPAVRLPQSLALDFFADLPRDSNVKASMEIGPAPVVTRAKLIAPRSNGISYRPNA